MIDISGISYFLPIASFVLVFVLVFAILKKTEILGYENFTNAIVSLILAIIFVSFSNVRSYVEEVSPWFIVLVVALFFALLLGAFAMKEDIKDVAKPGRWVFIGLLALVFLVIGYSHFDLACNSTFLSFKHWLFHEDVAGSIVLGIVALVVGIFITRKFDDD